MIKCNSGGGGGGGGAGPSDSGEFFVTSAGGLAPKEDVVPITYATTFASTPFVEAISNNPSLANVGSANEGLTGVDLLITTQPNTYESSLVNSEGIAPYKDRDPESIFTRDISGYPTMMYYYSLGSNYTLQYAINTQQDGLGEWTITDTNISNSNGLLYSYNDINGNPNILVYNQNPIKLEVYEQSGPIWSLVGAPISLTGTFQGINLNSNIIDIQDLDGYPMISYYDQPAPVNQYGRLMFGYYNGTSWTTTVVDEGIGDIQEFDFGASSKLAIISESAGIKTIGLSYLGQTYSASIFKSSYYLKYATAQSNDLMNWTVTVIPTTYSLPGDNNEKVNQLNQSGFLISANGQPAVAYSHTSLTSKYLVGIRYSTIDNGLWKESLVDTGTFLSIRLMKIDDYPVIVASEDVQGANMYYYKNTLKNGLGTWERYNIINTYSNSSIIYFRMDSSSSSNGELLLAYITTNTQTSIKFLGGNSIPVQIKWKATE